MSSLPYLARLAFQERHRRERYQSPERRDVARQDGEKERPACE
ncbi:hypothetical protein [Planomonospora sp. ID67723]|nr:hypothetical protein [Planomonospora sp. ID67723]